MKFLFSILLVALAAFSVSAAAASASVPSLRDIALSSPVLPMTEVKTITARVPFGGTKEDFETTNWRWTLDGKPFSAWRCYDEKSRLYNGKLFIKVDSFAFNDVTGDLELQITNALLYDTPNIFPPNKRAALLDFQGSHTLKLTGARDGQIFSAETALRIAPHDNYYTLDELYETARNAVELAKTKGDRYLEYRSLGISPAGNEIPLGIAAKDKADIDAYLNEWLPNALRNPAAAQKLVKEGVKYKIPLWVNNTHTDEFPGIDAMLVMFERLASDDEITYQTYESLTKADIPARISPALMNPYVKKTDSALPPFTTTVPPDDAKIVEKTIKVSDLLDNFIILFAFTNNPDGRERQHHNMMNGIDVNRDTAFQVTREVRAVWPQVSRWMPASLLDMHGYWYSTFMRDALMIDACTAPHDTNIEYDLYVVNGTPHARAMAAAGLAMSGYTDCDIPYEDYDNGLDGGWDDASPITNNLALYLGALSHTIELSDMTSRSFNAGVGIICASMNYMLNNKDAVYLNQLESWRRGVEDIDSCEVDKHLVGPKGETVGRPRKNNSSFFPAYYVIPVDETQKNLFEAYNMVDYALRNSWEIFTSDGGAFVIPTTQARRSLINRLMGTGLDVSAFAGVYVETTVCFPTLRNFTCETVWDRGVFGGKLTEYKTLVRPQSGYVVGAERYVIKNEGNSSTIAVNKILNSGLKVGMLENGDFLVDAKAAELIKETQIKISSFEGGRYAAKRIPKVKAYVPFPNFEVLWMLDYLGFEYTTLPQDAMTCNAILAVGDSDVKNLIESGTPYIGLNVTAVAPAYHEGYASTLDFLREKLGVDISAMPDGARNDGLFRAQFACDIITKGYDENGYVNIRGAAFDKVPQGAKVLVSVAERDAFVSGTDKSNTDESGRKSYLGKPLAVSMSYKGTPITVFALNTYTKGHAQGFYNLVSNAIFESVTSLAE